MIRKFLWLMVVYIIFLGAKTSDERDTLAGMYVFYWGCWLAIIAGTIDLWIR